MSATEELRRMLDERGVKWCPSAWDRSTETYWKTADGNECLATQGETKLRLSFADYLTPEQAIEATLGRGTRHAANVAEYAWDDFECSECGWVTWSFLMEHEGCGTVCKPRYCPNCGAKVVE